MEIHMNISFPRIPCELLTLDVMDVSGEQQSGIKHGISKVQLAPVKDGGMPLEISAMDLYALCPSHACHKFYQAHSDFLCAGMAKTKPPTSPPTTAVIATAPRHRRARSSKAAATPAKKCGKATPAYPGPSVVAKG